MKYASLALFLVSLPACAAAQVTINPAALQQLAGIAAPPPAIAAPVPAPKHHFPAAKPVQKPIVAVAARTPAPPPAPAAVAAPLVPSPPKPPAPIAPAPIAIIFAPGSSALPAGAAAALAPFCKTSLVLSVAGHAPADAANASVPMRLSMDRAMAVRDALTACGVPPQNILPRALGAVPGADPNAALLGIAAAK